MRFAAVLLSFLVWFRNPSFTFQDTSSLSLRSQLLVSREDEVVTMAKLQANTATRRLARQDAHGALTETPITNEEHAPNHKKVRFKASHGLLIAFLSLIMSVERQAQPFLQQAADTVTLACCRSSGRTSSLAASSSRDLFSSTSQHAASLPSRLIPPLCLEWQRMDAGIRGPLKKL